MYQLVLIVVFLLISIIDIFQLGWVGCALAFLTLCKVGFVSGFVCLVPIAIGMLKIAWGCVGKVLGCVNYYDESK